MMRFILALSPLKDFEFFLISTAQALFFPCSRGSLLSSKNLPHITLYQFECEKEENALALWTQMKKEYIRDFVQCFTGISFIKKQNLYQAELSVKRSSVLMEMHLFAKKIVQEKRFKKLTDDGDLYRPHITLAQIQIPDSLSKWPDSIFEKKIPFAFTLGLGNDLGQYLHTLAE